MRYLIKILVLNVILVAAFGCQKNEVQECIIGRVIGWMECISLNVIKIEDGSLKGDSITWNGISYDNVVQSCGGRIQDSIIYFNYRLFDLARDTFLQNVCPANVGPLAVPLIIITDFSSQSCPKNYEN